MFYAMLKVHMCLLLSGIAWNEWRWSWRMVPCSHQPHGDNSSLLALDYVPHRMVHQPGQGQTRSPERKARYGLFSSLECSPSFLFPLSFCSLFFSLYLSLSLTLVVTVQKVEQKSSVRNVFQTPLEVSLVSGCVMLGSLVSGIAQAVILLPHTTCVAVAWRFVWLAVVCQCRNQVGVCFTKSQNHKSLKSEQSESQARQFSNIQVSTIALWVEHGQICVRLYGHELRSNSI